MGVGAIAVFLRRGVVLLCLALPGLSQALTSHGLVMYPVGDGAYVGRSYFGSFAYEESALSRVGSEVLNLANGLKSLSIAFEGKTFNASSDVYFDEYPQVSFSDGIPTYINYVLLRGANNVTFADPQIDAVHVIGNLVPATEIAGYAVAGRVVLVPEPTTMTLLAGGLLSLAIARRRSRRD